MSQEMSSSSTTSNSAETNAALPCISKKTWDRFAALKERREKQSHRSTAKRVRDMKSALASKIEANFSSPDELAALKSNDVDLTSLCPKEKQQKKLTDSKVQMPSSTVCLEELQGYNTAESSWLKVKPYLDINSHLSDGTSTNAAPKSGLEVSINRAVALKEYDVAEQLSDRLASREFGAKIAGAIDAKRFTAKREHDAAVRKAAKKKKLAWGFEPKHRWETKGNM